jgi:hypothetical protein
MSRERGERLRELERSPYLKPVIINVIVKLYSLSKKY